MEVNSDIIQCPNCKSVELLDDVFRWIPDEYGYPTHESITCLDCLCSNNEIEFEEEGEWKTNEVVLYDEFLLVEFKDLSTKDQEKITNRIAELNAPKEPINWSGDLPF